MNSKFYIFKPVLIVISFYYVYVLGATGWTAGVRFRQGKEIFLYFTVARQALGLTQPPIQLVPGALSLEVKRPGHEADHSTVSSIEVMDGGAVPRLPYVSEVCLIN
jgi:hypothetical protein